jgi:hypothetical protein
LVKLLPDRPELTLAVVGGVLLPKQCRLVCEGPEVSVLSATLPNKLADLLIRECVAECFARCLDYLIIDETVVLASRVLLARGALRLCLLLLLLCLHIEKK